MAKEIDYKAVRDKVVSVLTAGYASNEITCAVATQEAEADTYPLSLVDWPIGNGEEDESIGGDSPACEKLSVPVTITTFQGDTLAKAQAQILVDAFAILGVFKKVFRSDHRLSALAGCYSAEPGTHRRGTAPDGYVKIETSVEVMMETT